jgi:hypothetical protein
LITLRTLRFLPGKPLRIVLVTLKDPASSDQAGKQGDDHYSKHELDRVNKNEGSQSAGVMAQPLY